MTNPIEKEQIDQILYYLNQVQSLIKFNNHRAMIGLTLMDYNNPYLEYKLVFGYYSNISEPRIVSELKSLILRLDRHAVHFIKICETFPQVFENHDRAIRFLETYEVMGEFNIQPPISDTLKRILMLSKLQN